MRVSRSLTIKQMVMVSVVALITICIFITIQLFYLVDQRKDDYIRQMWSMSHAVRDPLAQAVINVDIPQAQQLLNSLKFSGVLARTDLMLPGNVSGLSTSYLPQRPVPSMIVSLFDLPVQLSVPLYGTKGQLAARQPVAHLVMQIDSFRLYQFILSVLSTMVSAYLLLALILTVSISWCMNRLLVHPLRALAQELNAMPLNAPNYHQLTLPPWHNDDELGLLVRTYNRNQIALEKAYDMMKRMSARHPMTDMANFPLFFESELTQRVKERSVQEETILQGLSAKEFCLYLQPQFDLRTNSVVGAEALIRWNHQKGGATTPAEFVPLAEEFGGIMPLGDWVLEQVVQIQARWQAQGVRLPLALNVSGIQLSEVHFVNHLMALLERYAIDVSLLHLEVTETARIRDLAYAADTLARLRKRGVKVVLDDFGIGYVGLNYLQSLPVDIIKIDKSFVERLPQDSTLVRVVSAIAAELSLQIVAEGVENREQSDWLQRNGIFHVQGYLFSPGLSLNEFTQRYLALMV